MVCAEGIHGINQTQSALDLGHVSGHFLSLDRNQILMPFTENIGSFFRPVR